MKTNLEKLKGIGILCESAEHGKDMIDFFVEIGVDVMEYKSCSIELHYGVGNNGKFDCNPIELFNKILTLEQAKELVKEEEFPHDNWYIEVKEEYKKQLNDWKVNQEYDDDLYDWNYDCVQWNGSGSFSYLLKHLTQITFEQFKKHILKEE